MSDTSTIDWAALRAPFTPEAVDFRLQRNFEKGGKMMGIALAYMDARLVQNRLDEVVGPENWSFDWTPLITKGDVIIAAKGTLTICGISKSDVGDAGQTEPTKATVSDAFKRAAVMWGIGRYLYDLGTYFCETEMQGKSPAIPDTEIKRMRAKLPKPTGYVAPPAPAQTPTAPPPAAQPAPVRDGPPATPEARNALVDLAQKLGAADHIIPDSLSAARCSELGNQWKAEWQKKQQQKAVAK